MAPTYILLMGVQGAGKGTQADILKRTLNIPHVSTGDIFRAMRTLDTPRAREIQAIMNAGQLISDEITNELVNDRLHEADAQNGVMLDGFPRTRPQAEALDKMFEAMGVKLTAVLNLVITQELAIQRITDRWICSADANHVYNLATKPPKTPGVCDIDGAPLKQRADDTPDAAAQRISDYFAKTAPLLDYYRERGLLHEINADQPVEKVTADLLAALKQAQTTDAAGV
jgi:adenylate kinase